VAKTMSVSVSWATFQHIFIARNICKVVFVAFYLVGSF